MGITRIRVERSHQLADGRPWALARTPFPVVTHAAMAEARTMATASRPRFTQPKEHRYLARGQAAQQPEREPVSRDF